MQPLRKADRSTPQRCSTESNSHPERAIAGIWLVFYGVALGAAIISPLIARALELASR